MRKVFRMQYEPCDGLCYAPSYDPMDENYESFFAIRGLKDDKPRLAKLLTKLTEIHEPLCGNKNMRYAIDKDDVAGTFVGSFWHYGKLELVLGDNLLNTIEDLSELILRHFQTQSHKQDLKNDPGLGHSVCEHGVDEDLRTFVIEQARIPTPNGVEAYLQELAA